MTKIALLDDHQLFRKSLSLLLQSFDGLTVAFDTDDGVQLVEFMGHTQIDLVLLDVQTPQVGGHELCSLLKEKFGHVKILVISQLTTGNAVHKLLDLGANGFFTRNVHPEQLELAIQSVMMRGYYVNPELPATCNERVVLEQQLLIKKGAEDIIHLTAREVEIIKMASREMSSSEIGEKLFISIRTVEKHRNRIIEKTKSKNFIGVVLYAIRSNYISIDEI
jgi:DNA-binding NarL/FixJ family response regulator